MTTQTSIPSRTWLYESVLQKLSKLIDEGVLRPGDRVPSVRRLSQDQGVSVSTVLQAYLQLENRGYIQARPQSGYYVSYRQSLLPPEPRMTTPSDEATRVKTSELICGVFREARDPKLLRLGAAWISAELFPTARLNRILAGLARSKAAYCNQYDFPPGEEHLRREVARRSLAFGCSLSPDEIVTTVGAIEGLNLCLRAVASAGDAIAIESPTYYGTLQAIESLGMNAVEIPTNPRDGLSLDSLELTLKKRKIKAVVCCPNFSNPLGSLIPDENKQRLALLLEKHNIPLIENDVLGDLNFEGGRPKCVKAYDRSGLVLLCSSFSKTLAPGYRVGFVAPGRYQEQIEKLKFISTLATPTLAQMTIAEFLKNGGYEHHLRGLRRSFRHQVHMVSESVGRYFPEGTKITRPKGGFVLWVELPRSVDSLALHDKALNAGISICPGPVFSAKRKYKNFVRISCGQIWSDKINAGIERLGSLARELALKK